MHTGFALSTLPNLDESAQLVGFRLSLEIRLLGWIATCLRSATQPYKSTERVYPLVNRMAMEHFSAMKLIELLASLNFRLRRRVVLKNTLVVPQVSKETTQSTLPRRSRSAAGGSDRCSCVFLVVDVFVFGVKMTLTVLSAGGLWMPEAQYLTALRADINRRPQRLKQALRSEGMRREFLEGVEDDERKVVKEFVAQNSENALKTKPKVSEFVSFPSIRSSMP
jgi:sulfur carrier protein ThiS